MADEYAASLRPGVTTSSTSTLAAAGASGEDNPAITSPGYDTEKARRDRVRMVYGGTETVRAGLTDALPELPDEDGGDYERRRTIAALHPALEQTVEVSTGILLSQEPTFGDDMPAPLVALAENVDARGNHLAVFCEKLITNVLIDGRAGIFTDYPSLDRVLDADEEARLGVRPYFILVKANDVLRADYAFIDGVETLILFVRRETARVKPANSRFGQITVTRYRVYEHITGQGAEDGVWTETWEQREGESDVPKLVDGSRKRLRNQAVIPWSPIEVGTEDEDGLLVPPLHNQAYLVLAHHRMNTGRYSLAENTFAATLVAINAPQVPGPGNTLVDPDINIGSRKVLHVRYASGEQIPTQPVYYVQPDASVLEPTKEMLEALETQIQLAGRGLIASEKRTAETYMAKRLQNRAANATLSSAGRVLQDCLERAYQHKGQYIGVVAGSVIVNLDFEDALMEPQTMMAYVALVNAGYPKRLALEALQLGGRLSPDADLDEVELEWEGALVAQRQTEADALAAKQAEFAAGRNTQPQAVAA